MTCMRRTRVILVTCIGLVIQILYIKRARGSSLPLDRTSSLHRNPNTYFTLHTFYLYPLYLHIVPVLVISIHVNKAFQLIQLGPLQLPLGPTIANLELSIGKIETPPAAPVNCNYRSLVCIPPDLETWRAKLFTLDEPVTLSADEYKTY